MKTITLHMSAPAGATTFNARSVRRVVASVPGPLPSDYSYAHTLLADGKHENKVVATFYPTGDPNWRANVRKAWDAIRAKWGLTCAHVVDETGPYVGCSLQWPASM